MSWHEHIHAAATCLDRDHIKLTATNSCPAGTSTLAAMLQKEVLIPKMLDTAKGRQARANAWKYNRA